MTYRMILNQTSYFGRGAISNLADEVKSRGFERGLLITDKVLLETGVVKKITDILDAAGVKYDVFSDVAPNPPVENVKAGVAAAKKIDAQFLIGLGGGSP